MVAAIDSINPILVADGEMVEGVTEVGPGGEELIH